MDREVNGLLTHFPIFFLLALVASAALVYHWRAEARRHERRLASVQIRIHVNGIRGKSTVTRLVAGILREAGLRTVSKTTGTAAALVDAAGIESPVERRGAATILEQVEVVRRSVPPGTDAFVIECMALDPAYQRTSETKIIRSTIGILTNVREDHQDVMGATLPEIARSLLNTCPINGILVTSEQDPAILKIIGEEVLRRGSRLVVADPASVADRDLQGFDYVSFKENLAIGFALASILGIRRDVALRGMVAAPPDPGVLRFQHLTIGDKRVTWANLFASNDRESVIAAMKIIMEHRTADTTTVGILNNRADREVRCLQFADIASVDLEFDRVALFGAYEHVVKQRLVQNGYPAGSILQLGEQRDPSIDEILDRLVHRMPTPHVLLVGLANIHTKQAELLMERLEGIRAGSPGDSVESPARLELLA